MDLEFGFDVTGKSGSTNVVYKESSDCLKAHTKRTNFKSVRFSLLLVKIIVAYLQLIWYNLIVIIGHN